MISDKIIYIIAYEKSRKFHVVEHCLICISSKLAAKLNNNVVHVYPENNAKFMIFKARVQTSIYNNISKDFKHPCSGTLPN